MKMSLHHHPTSTHTTTETQFQQYLSCYLPNFEQTLKVISFWDQQQKNNLNKNNNDKNNDNPFSAINFNQTLKGGYWDQQQQH